MHNLQQPIKPITELCKVFPDIDGELCSRHSRLFGKLKVQFMKLYDSLQPTHYVVIKGSSVFFGECTEAKMSMALQNGIIILVKQTYKNTKIFINGNHLDQELIYNYDGKEYQGMHPQATNIAKCIQVANQNLSQEQLFGGIFYIHANIPQETLCYNEALQIGMFLGMLIINTNLQTFTTQQILDKLEKCNEKLSKNLTMRYFKYYAPRSFCLQVADKNLAIKLDPKIKNIVCKIEVAQDDLDYEKGKRKLLKQHREQMMRKLQSKYNITNVFETFTSGNIANILLDQKKSEMTQQETLTFQEHLQWQIQQMKMLCEFSNGNLSFGQLVDMKWKLDSQYWEVYSEEIVDLVEQLKKDLQLEHVMVIDSSFLLIVTDRVKFTDLLIKLRRKIHKGEMKSKSLFKIEQQLVENRFKEDVQIGEKMFTSAPSQGISIFDPCEQIWFEDD